MGLFYLSFAKPGKFLGIALVYADDALSAVKEAGLMGINPGGEIAVLELHDLESDKLRAVQENCGRLIGREELEQLFGPVMSIEDAQKKNSNIPDPVIICEDCNR